MNCARYLLLVLAWIGLYIGRLEISTSFVLRYIQHTDDVLCVTFCMVYVRGAFHVLCNFL